MTTEIELKAGAEMDEMVTIYEHMKREMAWHRMIRRASFWRAVWRNFWWILRHGDR